MRRYAVSGRCCNLCLLWRQLHGLHLLWHLKLLDHRSLCIHDFLLALDAKTEIFLLDLHVCERTPIDEFQEFLNVFDIHILGLLLLDN